MGIFTSTQKQTLTPVKSHIIGLDLGQTTDYSSLCDLTRMERWVDNDQSQAKPMKSIAEELNKPKDPTWGQLKADSNIIQHPKPGELTHTLHPELLAGDPAFDEETLSAQKNDIIPTYKSNIYLCRLLKRWQLGTSYVQIVQDVKKLLMIVQNAVLVVDNSGVGRPIIDMFRKIKLPCPIIPITITGGHVGRIIETDAGNADPKKEWHVPKVELIATLQVLLQEKRLGFVKGMNEVDTLLSELRTFQFKITKAANETFGAEQGAHDDLVLSAALASWWGERGGRRVKIW